MADQMGDDRERSFKVAELPADPVAALTAVGEIGRNVNAIAGDVYAATGCSLNDSPSGLFAVEGRTLTPITDAKGLHAYTARKVKNSRHPFDWRTGPG